MSTTRAGNASDAPTERARFHFWFTILGLHVLAMRIVLADSSAGLTRFAETAALTGLAAFTGSLTIASVAHVRSVSAIRVARACLAFEVVGLVACTMAGSFLLPWAALLGAVLVFRTVRTPPAKPSGGERPEPTLDLQEPFVITEKIQGEDLEGTLAREGRLSPGQVVRVVDDIAVALSAGLERGVIHGQIDPRKVVLVDGPEGFRAKLREFGTAWTPSLGRPSVKDAPGSAGYRAPEQVSAAFGPLSPRTDVFALGALAYRALSGREAFPARLPSEAAYEALHRVPEPVGSFVAELPRAIDAVLLVALAKDPSHRYPDARVFSVALTQAVSGEKSRETGERLLAARGEALQLAEPTVTIR